MKPRYRDHLWDWTKVFCIHCILGLSLFWGKKLYSETSAIKTTFRIGQKNGLYNGVVIIWGRKQCKTIKMNFEILVSLQRWFKDLGGLNFGVVIMRGYNVPCITLLYEYRLYLHLWPVKVFTVWWDSTLLVVLLIRLFPTKKRTDPDQTTLICMMLILIYTGQICCIHESPIIV